MEIIKKSWISDEELSEMFSSSYWNDEESEKKKSGVIRIVISIYMGYILKTLFKKNSSSQKRTDRQISF